MHCTQLWNVDSTKILTRRELATVLADLKAKSDRQANFRRNLVIVRLACCCGLRVSEIGGLQLDDLVLDVARPHMRLRRGTTQGKKDRCVPLWWDAGTLADLVAWKAERVEARSPRARVRGGNKQAAPAARTVRQLITVCSTDSPDVLGGHAARSALLSLDGAAKRPKSDVWLRRGVAPFLLNAADCASSPVP
jgi:integrase